jgi:hypothetical protein
VNEEEQKRSEKKRKQHEAWKRWYDSPKGKAYSQKRKEREILGPAKSEEPQT